jgi:hypothetical protein
VPFVVGYLPTSTVAIRLTWSERGRGQGGPVHHPLIGPAVGQLVFLTEAAVFDNLEPVSLGVSSETLKPG